MKKLARSLQRLREIVSIVWPLLAAVACLLWLASQSMSAMSSTRAYVNGESLWSKGHKDAVFHLLQFARTRDLADYARFENAIEVPLGDQQARLTLDGPSPDIAVARAGFLQGGIHPDDVDDVVVMFQRFRHVSFFAAAVDAWTKGDAYISQLRVAGLELRRLVTSGEVDPAALLALEERVRVINRELTPLTTEFSRVLGDAARRTRALLWAVMLAAAALLVPLGLLLVSRTLTRAEQLKAEQENLENESKLQRLALERMAQVDRAKTVFLATVSHEIRTPMNGVLGMTEVMLLESQTPRQREQLEVIQRSGRGLVCLVNDLLDLTKLEAGKLTVADAPFDLHAVFADLEAMGRPLGERKGLAVTFERAPEVPTTVRGDALRLTQVLNNLVNNAIKFTDAGTVKVTVAVRQGRLHFEITDTGIGISPEVLPRLFRPFEQADGSPTRRHGGTGLGLAISNQLVGLMGGQVEVKSEPAKGSTFAFQVPCISVERQPLAQVADAWPEGRSRRVLVVDDNPVNLRVATSLVEKAGFIPLRATNGVEALELMHREAGDVALVLMDCHMPEMDGFEATERIRALPFGQSLPIVALTASATPDDVAACLRAGMTEVLAKPISFDALRQMLGRLVNSRGSFLKTKEA